MTRQTGIAALVLVLAGPAVAAGLTETTAGRYIAHDRDGGDNVLEIVPLSRQRAYIRMRTLWANGHVCIAYGVFGVVGQSYVYDGPNERVPCQMTITLRRGRFAFDVTDVATKEPIQACLGSCGARGSFSRETRFRLSQRRTLHGLDRLRMSIEYEAALANDAGRIRHSDTLDSQELPEVIAAKAYEEMQRFRHD